MTPFLTSDKVVSTVPGLEDKVVGIGAGFCYFLPLLRTLSLPTNFNACCA